MKVKTKKIIYWIITVLFALMMLADGFAGVLRVEGGKEALAQLGYPEYLLMIVGAAKILGAAALLQNYFLIIKEWAYAGFTFLLLGAFASHFFSQSIPGFQILPLILLTILLISYYLWKKFQKERS